MEFLRKFNGVVVITITRLGNFKTLISGGRRLLSTKELFEDIIFQFLLMSAKMIFWSKNTHGSQNQNDYVINQHLSSKTISGVSLRFTAFVQLEIPGRCTLVEL